MANVGRATATLLARVESLDGETGALVDSLRGGATRLTSDLAAAETNMGELYGAASGGASDTVSAVAKEAPALPEPPLPPPDTPPSPVAVAEPAPAQSPPSPPAPPIHRRRLLRRGRWRLRTETWTELAWSR